MTSTTIPLERPLEAGRLAFLRVALGRSFTLELLEAQPGALTLQVRDALPADALAAVLRRALEASRHPEPDCLFRHAPAQPRPPQHDPQPELEARGDVQALGRGTFIYGGQFLAVRRAVRQRAERIAAGLEAREVDYPPLWPVPVLRDINYLHDFPQLVMLAGGLREDFAVRARFAERHRSGGGFETLTCDAGEDLAPIASVLAPTVCDCCYWMLRGRTDVSDQALTLTAPAFRNEASPEGRLDRLTAFSITEVVLIGREAFVTQGRERLIAAMQALVVELDLACAIVGADDPFFSNDALYKDLYQHVARLKYEVRAELYDGRTLAIASINLHQEYFSRSYDYRGADGERLHSGCVGFGLERFAYALFCRHGADVAGWPDSVRGALGV